MEEFFSNFSKKLEVLLDQFNSNSSQTITELNNIASKFNETTSEHNNEFKVITDKVKNMTSEMESFVKEVNDLNLSLYLDKLDSNLAGIIQSTQNIIARIETLENNIKESIGNLKSDLLN